MVEIAITTRPTVVETGAGRTVLTALLATIEAVIGHASIYGFEDAQRARYFTAGTLEAGFSRGYYREGFVTGGAPTFMPSWSFARTGAGLAQTAGGSWQTFASGAVRLTDKGLLVEPARTNRLAMDNAAPTVTTGLTKGGDAASVLSVVTDTAALRAAGFADLIDGGVMNGKVFRLNNIAGSAQAYVIVPGATANANVHSLSAVVRGSGSVGLRTGATLPANSSFVLGAGWVRREASQATLTAGDKIAGDVMILTVTPGGDLYFILPQFEEGNGATAPIVTTGASATRGADAPAWEAAAAPAGGLMVGMTVPAAGASTTGASWDNGSLDCYVAVFLDGGAIGVSVFQDGQVVYNASRTGFVPGDNVRAFVGWADGLIVAAVDGVALANGAYVYPMTMHTVRPGTAFYGDQARGYVRRVLTFDFLPTAAERLAMTETQ